MPFVYQIARHTNDTTSGTANTEVDHLRTATGTSRQAAVTALYVIGKGAGLTAISGIVFRLRRFATASTAGTAITPTPKDPTAPASTITAATLPTAGSTGTNQIAIGCGAAGPGGWVARDRDSEIVLAAGGGANGNLDLFSASGTVSLSFEYALEHME
jgi:hypothetical protein